MTLLTIERLLEQLRCRHGRQWAIAVRIKKVESVELLVFGYASIGDEEMRTCVFRFPGGAAPLQRARFVAAAFKSFETVLMGSETGGVSN